MTTGHDHVVGPATKEHAMRTTTLARRATAAALAGTLAFGMAACAENDGADVDTEASEGEIVDDAATEAEDAASEMGTEMDDAVSTEDDG